jgi:hypothetical protein
VSDDLREQANRAALYALERLRGPEVVESLARDVTNGIFGLIQQQIDWKFVDPGAAAVFHDEMVKGIRARKWYPGKWLAMYHHKRLRVKWRALATSQYGEKTVAVKCRL